MLTLFVGALTAAAIFAPLPAAQAVTFVAAPNAPAGTGPQYVAVGDFNGDSDPDLAVPNNGSQNVSILLGGAGGSFGAPANLSGFDLPDSIAVADVNGDGDPDLAIANDNSVSGNPETLEVLVGGAGASFTPATSIPLYDPESVVTGDFNGDGDPDFAVSNTSANNFSVLLGAAGAAFTGPTNYPVANFPRRMAVGDFNLDGDPDLAVPNEESDSVSVYLGGLGGTFANRTDYSIVGGPPETGAGPVSVAVGDFNGDGDPDLAVANEYWGKISVFTGGAGGSFTGPTTVDVSAINSFLSAVVVGEFNGDTDPDLALSIQGTNTAAVLTGTAGAGFSAPTHFAAGSGPTHIAVGNFNGDLNQDLAVSNEVSNNVSILLSLSEAPYPRPNGAAKTRLTLVPAHAKCLSPTTDHAAPFPSGAGNDACSPTSLSTDNLTVPNDDSTLHNASVTFRHRCSNGGLPPDCGAAGDQSEAVILATVNDVRCAATASGATPCGSANTTPGTDYAGTLLLRLPLRITDGHNGAATNLPATVIDANFTAGLACTATAGDTARGSSCSVNTSTDALVPDFAREGKRSNVALGQVEILDMGDNGTLATGTIAGSSGTCPPACKGNGDEQPFLRQGIFVP